MAAAAGVTSLGPAVIVSGCLRGTNDADQDDATEFALNELSPAVSLTGTSAPSGITQFRIIGLVPDLQRHAGSSVEIIGSIVEESPENSVATLDAKSVRARGERCSP